MDGDIQDLLATIADYRRGALGNIRQLPIGYVALLRIADGELKTWEFEQDRQARA